MKLLLVSLFYIWEYLGMKRLNNVPHPIFNFLLANIYQAHTLCLPSTILSTFHVLTHKDPT